jgi:hypothetical protein
MPELSTIYDYMRRHAALLGDRILQEYPALHQFDDAVSPRIEGLLRTPSLHRPLPSWEWLNAGSRRGQPWWLRNVEPARH